MTQPGTALARLAERVAVEPVELQQTLVNTVFKGANPAEFTVLVALANKYDLDPFAKEIYAFARQGGGIMPLVPIDGWLKVIHRHPDYDGMETIYAEEMVQPSPKAKRCYEWVETRIFHKSTPERPTVHREYIDEMYRDTGPWNSTPKRMLEWKSIIQCGRKAFGLGGIYDADEAERMSYDYEVSAEVVDETDDGQVIDETQLVALLDEMRRTGLSDVAVRRNLEARAGYRGPLEDMPLKVYESLMAGLAKMPDKTPPTEPQAASGSVAEDAAEEPAAAAPDEDCASFFPTDDEEPPGMDAEAYAAYCDAKAGRPGPSAAEAGRRAAERAQSRSMAKPISAKQVNLLYTQCTICEVDEKAALHDYLGSEIGVGSVKDIPAARFDEVLTWVKSQATRRREAS